MARNNDRKYLSDADLLKIYGITHPDENLSGKATQKLILAKMRSQKKYEDYHIIKNKWIRWFLIIAFVIGSALLISYILQSAGNKLSWERV